eukprot:748099-Hanusia_phi.AAC.2
MLRCARACGGKSCSCRSSLTDLRCVFKTGGRYGIGLKIDTDPPHRTQRVANLIDAKGQRVEVVKIGDYLRTIDGQVVALENMEGIERKILGAKNTTVTLSFRCSRTQQDYEVTAMRHIPFQTWSETRRWLEIREELYGKELKVEPEVLRQLEAIRALLCNKSGYAKDFLLNEPVTLESFGLVLAEASDSKSSSNRIAKILPGSPAFMSGKLKEGDEVVAIDSVQIEDRNIQPLLLNKGFIGSNIVLSVRRAPNQIIKVPVFPVWPRVLRFIETFLASVDSLQKLVKDRVSEDVLHSAFEKLISQVVQFSCEDSNLQLKLSKRLFEMQRSVISCLNKAEAMIHPSPIGELRAKVDSLQKENFAMGSEYASMKKELEEISSGHEHLTGVINKKDIHIQNLELENQLLNSRIQELNTSFASFIAREDFVKLENEKSRADKTIADLTTMLQELDTRLRGICSDPERTGRSTRSSDSLQTDLDGAVRLVERHVEQSKLSEAELSRLLELEQEGRQGLLKQLEKGEVALTTSRTNIKELQNLLATEIKKHADTISACQTVEERRRGLEMQLEEAKVKAEELQSQVVALRSQIALRQGELGSTLEELHGSVVDAKQSIASLQSRNKVSKEVIDNLRQQMQTMVSSDQFENVSSELKRTKERESSRIKELTEAKDEISQLNSSLLQTESEIRILKSGSESFKKEIASLQSRLTDTTKQNEILREEVENGRKIILETVPKADLHQCQAEVWSLREKLKEQGS